ncbi:TetR/AcrR family transcriptional regulator [Clostridium sp. CM027]|uniref:TetR/AcrR family transcriptional regulator n=1 Tax=Clostridium sp. CM027 TaxID=2849865 RepID=UPI001C6E9701|nr:TetR/AcrR family transcriptional regulator [Clostridium sp. CM027]MBW9146590.1 TetR/AcrR family transcriptional regulator [Clostridium sp. CM027]UVE42272.1 TetR/AcrR family transcriptional regulator [Clostridium sp. CM027]
MIRKIRVPIQKRSIEKRKNIIDAALKLFNTKGYFNTSMAEIAKEADLAIGGIYAYFKDKKDIFLELVSLYGNTIYNHSVEELSKIKDTNDLDLMIKTTINIILQSHKIFPKFHKEIMILCSMDNEIKYQVREQQKPLLNKYQEEFKNFDLNLKNKSEKNFLLYSLIEDTCHEIIYDEKSILNKNILVEECAEVIKKILL